jgi:hypothetical protein
MFCRDQTSAPSVSADSALEEFLQTHELAATEAVDGSKVQPPKRSLEPTSVAGISECVAYNVVVVRLTRLGL